ncbi:MAG: hypothetical protein L3J43_07315 [Sulfurovum sp.]|nr:hypothetical protein [Sulfurovum sp.]
MKISDVPQEKNKTLGGVRKAMYAVGEDGTYVSVASDGWKAEEIVTSQAVEEFERLASIALVEVKKELASPLSYHMYKNRMDLTQLSQSTGFFKWTIKKDFKVEAFKKISQKRLQTYANVMGIKIEELLTVPTE